jgi:hypothetical protein
MPNAFAIPRKVLNWHDAGGQQGANVDLANLI